MLQNVIFDLRVFLLFYAIMLFFFSLLFSVLGVGNFKLNEEHHGRILKASGGKGGSGGGATSGVGQTGDLPA